MTESLGQKGERLVEKKYLADGFRLLERNYILPFGKQTGELDLIFAGQQEIVFVEVKTRTNERFGSAVESVDYFKQRKLIRTAKLYMQQHSKFRDWNYRIDVATVDIDNPANPVIILVNAIEDLD